MNHACEWVYCFSPKMENLWTSLGATLLGQWNTNLKQFQGQNVGRYWPPPMCFLMRQIVLPGSCNACQCHVLLLCPADLAHMREFGKNIPTYLSKIYWCIYCKNASNIIRNIVNKIWEWTNFEIYTKLLVDQS